MDVLRHDDPSVQDQLTGRGRREEKDNEGVPGRRAVEKRELALAGEGHVPDGFGLPERPLGAVSATHVPVVRPPHGSTLAEVPALCHAPRGVLSLAAFPETHPKGRGRGWVESRPCLLGCARAVGCILAATEVVALCHAPRGVLSLAAIPETHPKGRGRGRVESRPWLLGCARAVGCPLAETEVFALCHAPRGVLSSAAFPRHTPRGVAEDGLNLGRGSWDAPEPSGAPSQRPKSLPSATPLGVCFHPRLSRDTPQGAWQRMG